MKRVVERIDTKLAMPPPQSSSGGPAMCSTGRTGTMSSTKGEDAQFRTLVGRLTPTVRRRVLYAALLSPATPLEEMWTLGALYSIRAEPAEE